MRGTPLPGALARRPTTTGESVGILPGWLGRTNTHHTPAAGVALFALVSAAVTAAAGAQDQELVLLYAVAVFISFLVGLLAMARFALREHHRGSFTVNLVGAVVVAFTLVVNLTRGTLVFSLAASLIIAAGLYWVWAKAGRPRGIASVVADTEHEPTKWLIEACLAVHVRRQHLGCVGVCLGTPVRTKDRVPISGLAFDLVMWG